MNVNCLPGVLPWCAGRSSIISALVGLCKPHEEPALRRAVLVDERWQFVLREVAQPRFHDGISVVADRPSRPLCLLVDCAMDRQCAIGHFVGVIAPHDALLIDGQLHDQLRMLIARCGPAQTRPRATIDRSADAAASVPASARSAACWLNSSAVPAG